MASPTYHPPWYHEFREGLPCQFCGNQERPVLAVAGATAGVCEVCTAHAHWTWKLLSGDAVPVDTSTKITRVKVIVSRLAKLPAGAEAAPEHPESYELAMQPNKDGVPDLLSADVGEGEGELAAVDRALAGAGLATWPIFVFPLYAAATPRGSLARIYAVKAYVDATPERQKPAYQWRDWPPWKHAQGMEGLYLGLADTWPLLIAKHFGEDPATSQLTTLVREGAAKYLRVQQSLREGKRDVDTSMLEYLRKSMTDDEKLVCKMVQAAADLEAERAADQAESKAEAELDVGTPYREGEPQAADDEIVEPEGDEESLEDAFADDKEG